MGELSQRSPPTTYCANAAPHSMPTFVLRELRQHNLTHCRPCGPLPGRAGKTSLYLIGAADRVACANLGSVVFPVYLSPVAFNASTHATETAQGAKHEYWYSNSEYTYQGPYLPFRATGLTAFGGGPVAHPPFQHFSSARKGNCTHLLRDSRYPCNCSMSPPASCKHTRWRRE
jgi:hypothetical protein